MNLYWMHNSEDGSTQKKAYLELYINGVKETKTLTYDIPDDKADEVTTYSIDTSGEEEYIMHSANVSEGISLNDFIEKVQKNIEFINELEDEYKENN